MGLASSDVQTRGKRGGEAGNKTTFHTNAIQYFAKMIDTSYHYKY